ncbi:hypothetical protein [Erwinia rhapontici]|uniref:hypothetical protein n=1 Tax=Erwinia rhapontici TaxID=55212 RepID=UPI0010608D29|nr:hypothetical protein [Erwinia rhapontici]TDS89592.1 hypothetical protein EDF84_11539 [Erwinia rhapontici]
MKITGAVFLTVLMLCLKINHAAAAYSLIEADVASGYSNCRIYTNSGGISTAEVDISYKDAAGRLGSARFMSRGLLFYTYSKSGMPINIKPTAFSLGGVKGYGSYIGVNYLMLSSVNAGVPWITDTALTRTASIDFQTSVLNDWPAVSIRAGNFTSGDDVGDLKSAYISRDSGGGCEMITDPTQPPAPTLAITFTAPDWELGEIKTGEQVIPFSASVDQLCLTYSSVGVNGKQFIINASSGNGTVNNQYQLKNIQNMTQSIPYTLTLNSGSNTITLPNSSLTALPLLSSGKTCFLPTFRTFAPKGIKKGDYSDVLTFNIVTKA